MTVPVSSTLESPVPSETTLENELGTFRELFRRLINALINQVFDLRPQRAVQRMQYLIFLFLLAGFLATITHPDYSLPFWAGHLRSIFLYLFNPPYAANYPGNPFIDFLSFAVDAFTDPRTLQYLPIFLAPFFIALQCAAIYLADVFELQNNADIEVGVRVARDFIWEVALSGSDKTIRIQQGGIAEEHRLSPNYLIGGPGKVIVDLDSVALFEKPDGTPHIIGPTGREPGGRATLDGFERFRQAIDIRDQYVDLRDQDSKAQSVKGRSRDGIPITATDVRLMFSVYRGENPKKTDQFPYPFSNEAIEQIVYRASSRVTPEATNPSAYEFSWIYNMIGLIRGMLGGFMSEHKLSDYLASIGKPEFDRVKQREELIAEQVRRLTPQTEDEGEGNEVKPPPLFTPRYEITNLFSQFAEGFTKSARNSGVELRWIGVGTWKTPPEIDVVSEKHFQAWQLSQENLREGSEEALKGAEYMAALERLKSLIQSVPLDAFEEHTIADRRFRRSSKKDDRKKETGPLDSENLGTEGVDDLSSLLHVLDRRSSSSGYPEPDHDTVIRQLVMDYRKQLAEARDFMKSRNEDVPPKIQEAIAHLDRQTGPYHWAGST
jgi:hypothetical protein